MKRITLVSKIALFAVVALGALAIAVGTQSHTAFANGESFGPQLTFSTSLGATYDSASNGVRLSGGIALGTEAFNTMASCSAGPATLQAVTGPISINSASYVITNSSGTSVLSGSVNYVPAGASRTIFGKICAGTPAERDLTEFPVYNLTGTINVASLSGGTYTMTVTAAPECVPSAGSAFCSPMPTNAVSSASFTIPTIPTYPTSGSSVNITSVTVTGTTVKVSGNYDAGNVNVLTPCTGYPIDVPLPHGGITQSLVYSTDDGISGSSPHTVTTPGSDQTCAGLPGAGGGEVGTFLFSFVDPSLPSLHNVTVRYSDTSDGGTPASDAKPYGSAAAAPTVRLTATSPITIGNSTNLTITSANATACVGAGSNNGNWNGAEPLSGSVSKTPGSVGNATFNITCTGPGGSANDSVVVTVNPAALPGASTGTITVASQNSITGGPVNGQWDILGAYPAGNDVCSGSVVCNGSSQRYTDQPATADGGGTPGDLYTMPYGAIALASPAQSGLYAFKSMQLVPVAKVKSGLIDTMLTLTKNIFGSTAQAFTIPPANPLAQTLNPGNSIAYIILWDPKAGISVAPTPLPISTPAGGSKSGTVNISNTGAPGSTLTWTTTSDRAWLSASPAADATGLTNGASGNASENVTINTNATGLASGFTDVGHVTFHGVSAPGAVPAGSLDMILTVNLTVTSGGGGGPYFSCGAGVCAITATPGPLSCATACGGAGAVTVSCTPSSITLSQTSQCTLKINGVPQPGSWTVTAGSTGSIGAASGVYTPSAAGVESVTGTLPDGTSAQGTITVSVAPPVCTPGVNCPTCVSPALSALPANIVVPESSNLNYSCSHITICSLSGGGNTFPPTYYPDPAFPGTTIPTLIASGTQSVAPASTTIYTLSCSNANYTGPSASVNSTVQVTVGGSGRCEQNPNGAGCPGQ